MMKRQVIYTKPEVLAHQPIQFETAQSWNKGHGNLDHPGNGNGGTHYPNDPYTGPRPKPWHGGGGGKPGGGNGKGRNR
ncbi:hypothetical protein [Rossellomorea sp. DA94]|uniref:hypothetical protein n=1 Tax=Rossellomorea sp. DA94 TaxID=3038653 RepID=UPI00244C6571|nr:hypothetical protein [Rossellomorea sp. DA94]WGG45881.1 hypothetical protein P8596_01200 [Rossellomorea sp. DA94]